MEMPVEKCVLPGFIRVYRTVGDDSARFLSLEVFVEERADKRCALVKYFANGVEVNREDFKFLRSLM